MTVHGREGLSGLIFWYGWGLGDDLSLFMFRLAMDVTGFQCSDPVHRHCQQREYHNDSKLNSQHCSKMAVQPLCDGSRRSPEYRNDHDQNRDDKYSTCRYDQSK